MKAILKLPAIKALACLVCLAGSFGVGYWYGMLDPNPIHPVLPGDAPRLEPVPAATAPPDGGAKPAGGWHPAHE